MNFKLFLEAEKAPYVYHVTYAKNIPGILSNRLIPAGGHSPYTKPHLQIHSQKGVFFSQQIDDANEWVGIMLYQAMTHMKNSKDELDFVPVILRFKLNRNAWKPDEKIEPCVGSGFYTPRTINPIGLELWDGRKWTKNFNDVENLKNYMAPFIKQGDDDMDLHDEYPLPN